ncbi:hypothetical protein C8A01DRAFT_21200 [Parachaetomium inaequale]|uniref:Uncharacterized protein n=1 Tax=Parachaetomium inaequale TaxID=2588326 RepID=A0AAN6SLE3_9PEZI|nr:hypothetical protein C8A01DRAFT_21200 [Parachaetomium inaequale]
MPCIDCTNAKYWDRSPFGSAQSHAETHHPDWRIRYLVVHPRDSAIFGLLHACRESRGFWLTHYHRVPRYIDIRKQFVPMKPRDSEIQGPYNIRFDIPFHSDLIDRDPDPMFRTWDAFLGLDYHLIQHVGLRTWDLILEFAAAMHEIWPPALPSLGSVSLITLGPDPGLKGRSRPGWVQMGPRVPQRAFDFELRDISATQLERHPLFRDRIISKYGTTGPPEAPVRDLVLLAKAWLWHIANRELEGPWNCMIGARPDYMTVVPRWHRCPIYDGSQPCIPHTRQEILDWEPPYELTAKFFCERSWLADLESVGVFDDDRTGAGDFAAFFRLRDEEVDRPALFVAKAIVDGILDGTVTPK